MQKKLLFVVHRYPPFPGGSEYYVRDMAECAERMGHKVTVLSGQHDGNLNNVRVTDDPNILVNELFDLIIVHGGNVGMQDIVHQNSMRIPSPILFMIILPSDSNNYQVGMKHAKFIGCSTLEDWKFVEQMGYAEKAFNVPHGIDKRISVGQPGFRQKYGIETPYMFLSCGGFWPHKAMNELVDLFKQTNRDDITLVLTGYDNRHNIMPQKSSNVLPLMIDDRNDVMSAMADADLYIMHSFSEGFGLVLLESMLNKVPWAARNIAGAKLMASYGLAYDTDEQLVEYMRGFNGKNIDQIENAYAYVTNTHMIENTVNSILALA